MPQETDSNSWPQIIRFSPAPSPSSARSTYYLFITQLMQHNPDRLYPAVYISFSRSLFQAFVRHPLPLWPCGVHCSVVPVWQCCHYFFLTCVQVLANKVHFLLLSWSNTGSWSFSRNSSLAIIVWPGQWPVYIYDPW